MPLITHVFESHKRFEHGVEVSCVYVPRRANFEYDATGNSVIISIMPTLSPKKAYLVGQDGFILSYKGQDPDYRFVIECWPDNGTIKRMSVFRDDIGLEIRYLSTHQEAF